MREAREPFVAVSSLSTTLLRARVMSALQVGRMQQSLSRHGQLSPVVVVGRGESLEIVDGFKRRAAAEAMGWPRLRTRVVEADERSQWVLMLSLNRPSASLTEVEEALVLREMVGLGLSQTEIGELLGRHKSWVSRRIGLVERLHAELLEWVKVGLLSAGTARRLLSLPGGNQLDVAAVVREHKLGPQETERLVSLWRGTTDPEIRRYLAEHPRQALRESYPESASEPPDPRLTPQGQRLRRCLRIASGTATRAARLLEPLPAPLDLAILGKDLGFAERSARMLVEAVGRVELCVSSAGPSESGGTA